MGIPELLRGVLKDRGYRSVDEMAWEEGKKLGQRINPGTLRTWMTANDTYRRRPITIASLRILESITGRSLDDLVGMIEQDAREPSAVRT